MWVLFVAGIMLPNVVFMINHKDGFENKYQNKFVETLEQIGRVGCIVFMSVSSAGDFGFWK